MLLDHVGIKHRLLQDHVLSGSSLVALVPLVGVEISEVRIVEFLGALAVSEELNVEGHPQTNVLHIDLLVTELQLVAIIEGCDVLRTQLVGLRFTLVDLATLLVIVDLDHYFGWIDAFLGLDQVEGCGDYHGSLNEFQHFIFILFIII